MHAGNSLMILSIACLKLDWAFITDESSLWDFTGDSSLKEFQDRIFLIYGVAVYDIEAGNLATILERIEGRVL